MEAVLFEKENMWLLFGPLRFLLLLLEGKNSYLYQEACVIAPVLELSGIHVHKKLNVFLTCTGECHSDEGNS